ncbi:MAG: PilZ domain-containing protein [Desulfopila sp.]|nr:PilZ domain-containing protein [Desulfopila sp.]
MGEDDRRRFLRGKKQSVISFHIIEDDGLEIKKEAVVVDGSRGGLRFRSQESLPKNTRIYIKLDSDDWGDELTYFCKDGDLGLVEVIGRVMWCLENEQSPGEYEIGTRFLSGVEH